MIDIMIDIYYDLIYIMTGLLGSQSIINVNISGRVMLEVMQEIGARIDIGYHSTYIINIGVNTLEINCIDIDKHYGRWRMIVFIMEKLILKLYCHRKKLIMCIEILI